MKKPNFFILGAPKCGTTTLADWLRAHPGIFMCDPKEPHYFNTDSGHHGALDLAHYESFFAGAGERHLAVGEASVWYLVSDAAVPNILAYQPAARFIVCVRNPIEMAVSLHDQKRFSGDEPIADFERAWAMQEARLAGAIRLPPTCTDVRQLAYGPSCMLGRQLERLFAIVPRQTVHIVMLEDMQADPRAVYQSVLRFLEVPSHELSEFSRSNPAKRRKMLWLRRGLRHVTLLKNRLGIKRGTGLGAAINRWNSVERERRPTSLRVRSMLRTYFAEDIRLLESLLGRPLDHWLD